MFKGHANINKDKVYLRTKIDTDSETPLPKLLFTVANFCRFYSRRSAPVYHSLTIPPPQLPLPIFEGFLWFSFGSITVALLTQSNLHQPYRQH